MADLDPGKTAFAHPNWWQPRTTPAPPDGYVDLIESMRGLQDALASAVPDADMVTDVRALLDRASSLLATAHVDEWSRLSGFSASLPNRGSFLRPPFAKTHHDNESVRGSVRFSPYYLGGNGAAHGGSIPLLLDEVLGMLANYGSHGICRTAYLHVDYRNVTPIERDLQIEARVRRVEGRKHWITGTVHNGDILCIEAEGLFIELRPGQE